ncbi:MAG: hypothetical protein WBK28_02550 [Minisyncoccia bacterium]
MNRRLALRKEITSINYYMIEVNQMRAAQTIDGWFAGAEIKRLSNRRKRLQNALRFWGDTEYSR